MQAAFRLDSDGSACIADLRRGGSEGAVFHFCPVRVAGLLHEPDEPDLSSSRSAFADPSFPPPTSRLRLPTASMDHCPWTARSRRLGEVHPYEAGQYAQAADALELLEAYPQSARCSTTSPARGGRWTEGCDRHLRHGDRPVGRLSGHGDGRLRLRPHPRRARLRGAGGALCSGRSGRACLGGAASRLDGGGWEAGACVRHRRRRAAPLLRPARRPPRELEALARRRETAIVLTCPFHRRDAVASRSGSARRSTPAAGRRGRRPVPGQVFAAGDTAARRRRGVPGDGAE